MICLVNFFASIEPWTINAVTILGTVFSLGFSIFAFWFAKKWNDQASEMTSDVIKNTKTIEAYSDQIHKNTRILRLDGIRTYYELSKGQSSHVYWHFRWRFETYDSLQVTIKEYDQNRAMLGGCEISIKGFSVDANYEGFESRGSEFYVVEIQKIMSNTNGKFPYALNERLACFEENGKLIISKGIDPWTTQARYYFDICGIGKIQTGYGEPTADDSKVFPRIKDSTKA